MMHNILTYVRKESATAISVLRLRKLNISIGYYTLYISTKPTS